MATAKREKKGVQFTKDGKNNGPFNPKPAGANDIRFFWEGRRFTRAYWTKDGKRMAPDIPVPPGSNDAHIWL